MFAARIAPPILPPVRPIFTKYSLTAGGIFFLAMIRLYVTGSRKATLDIRKGVTYTKMVVKKKAPISAETPTGATIHTTEAARTRNPIIRLQAVELKRRFHDLPQLPDRL